MASKSKASTKTARSTPAKKADAAKDAPAKKASPAAAKSTSAKSTPAKKASPAEGTSAKTASAGKSASGKRVNSALMRPLQPSNELAAVVGSKPLPRPEVVSKVWDYIKTNKLQDPQNKREIVADDKLRAVFGKDSVTMFEMNKHLAQHLK
jgi:upstream activation factor subunit UAF30